MRILTFIFSLFLFFVPLVADEDVNSIIVTDNGLEMFQWDLDFVKAAKESIEISAVYLGGDIAQKLFSALEERLDQVDALQVYILTTPVFLEPKDWDAIERLQKKYPHQFHLEHATSIAKIWPDVTGVDNHVKMFIVDEKYFSCGGTNLDEAQCSEGTWTPKKNPNRPVIIEGFPTGMRDQDIVGKGPLAKELRLGFHKLYALWEHYNTTGIFEKNPEKFSANNHYFVITQKPSVVRFDSSERRSLVKSEGIQLIFGGPYQEHNAITKAYIKSIHEAKEEIIIANMYFCPVDPIFDALLEAIRRGVKLTILTNGISDVAPEYTQYFCWANRIHYVPMLYGKKFHFWDAWAVSHMATKATRIYEYHVKDILLHKKMMIIDNKFSIIGSYNLGLRSDFGDYELIVKIDSKEVAKDLKAVHEKDLSHSKEISSKDARSWYFDPLKVSLGEMQKRFHGLL